MLTLSIWDGRVIDTRVVTIKDLASMESCKEYASEFLERVPVDRLKITISCEPQKK
jgi:hypothetical protein